MADDTTKQLPANVTALITVDTMDVLTAVNAPLPALVNAIQKGSSDLSRVGPPDFIRN